MNKSVVIGIIIVIVVLAGGGALLAAHHKSSPTSSTADTTSNSMANMASSSSGSSSQSGSSTPATATNSVTIQNFAFSPANITVKKGTTVTWTNQDSTAHTVTENDGQTGPGSGDIATGKSYSFTYNTVGTFKYHCSIHPDMTGTVTVTE